MKYYFAPGTARKSLKKRFYSYLYSYHSGININLLICKIIGAYCIYVCIWVCTYAARRLSRRQDTVIILFVKPLYSPRSRGEMKKPQLKPPLYRLGPTPVDTAASSASVADSD